MAVIRNLCTTGASVIAILRGWGGNDDIRVGWALFDALIRACHCDYANQG